MQTGVFPAVKTQKRDSTELKLKNTKWVLHNPNQKLKTT